MRTPVIYLSGPISNGGQAPMWEQHENVRYACETAHMLRKRGFAVINPMSTWLEEREVKLHLSHEDWIRHDLPIIEKCDALLRLAGESSGADREVAHAISKSIWVFHDWANMYEFFKQRGMVP